MAPRSAGLRILLAEDEALAALVIRDALADRGHAGVHAADGETAFGLASALPFDVLITDIAMPRLSGLRLFPLLRAERPELPVVLLTGRLLPDTVPQLAPSSEGRTALLLKAFILHHLAEALARVAPTGVPGAAPNVCGAVPDLAAPAGLPRDQARPMVRSAVATPPGRREYGRQAAPCRRHR